MYDDGPRALSRPLTIFSAPPAKERPARAPTSSLTAEHISQRCRPTRRSRSRRARHPAPFATLAPWTPQETNMNRQFLDMPLHEAMRRDPKVFEALERVPALSAKLGDVMKGSGAWGDGLI